MSNEPMPRIRLRWWLPVANLAIDAALLGMMAWSMHLFHRSEKQIRYEKNPVRQEEQAAVGWDIRNLWVHPPPQFYAVVVGTLPSGAVSAGEFGNLAWWYGISLRWVCLHEGLAIPVWFCVGWLAERPPGRKWALRYLALRLVSVPPWFSKLCVLPMLLAWFAAGIWLLGWGLQSGVRMVRGSR